MTTANSRRISLSRGLLIGLLGSTFSLAANSASVIVEADSIANDDAPSMSVSYAGLDLDDPASMHILYGRLKVAARLVCGGDISGVREVQRIFAHKACVDDALDSAIDSIGNAALTTLHQESATEAPVSYLPTPEAAGDREVEHEERSPFHATRVAPAGPIG